MVQRIEKYRTLGYIWKCDCGRGSQVVQTRAYTVRNAQAHARQSRPVKS